MLIIISFESYSIKFILIYMKHLSYSSLIIVIGLYYLYCSVNLSISILNLGISLSV